MNNKSLKYRRPNAGFTLIELLIVIAIIAIMVAGWGSTLSRSRATGRIIKAEANMTLDSAALERALIHDINAATSISWDKENRTLTFVPDKKYVLSDRTILRGTGATNSVIAEGIIDWRAMQKNGIIYIQWENVQMAGQANRSRWQVLTLLPPVSLNISGIPQKEKQVNLLEEGG